MNNHELYSNWNKHENAPKITSYMASWEEYHIKDNVILLSLNTYIYIYNQMLSDMKRNGRKINWAVLVKNLLAELGFYEVWLQQNVGDHDFFFFFFLVLFKQRVKDNFIQLWIGVKRFI